MQAVVGTNGPMNRKRREQSHNKKVDNGTKGNGKLRRAANLWRKYLDFFFFKFRRFVRGASRNALWTGYGR